MHGVAKRVEDRPDLVVDLVGQGHHVEGGQAQVFGEGPCSFTPMPRVAGSRWNLPARLCRDCLPIR